MISTQNSNQFCFLPLATSVVSFIVFWCSFCWVLGSICSLPPVTSLTIFKESWCWCLQYLHRLFSTSFDAVTLQNESYVPQFHHIWAYSSWLHSEHFSGVELPIDCYYVHDHPYCFCLLFGTEFSLPNYVEISLFKNWCHLKIP